MNQSVDFSKLGGLYVFQDTLDFVQTAYSQNIDAISKAFGDKLIISGVTKNGNQYTDGSVIINGERLPFVGGTPLTNVKIETIVTKEQFDDQTQKDLYFTKRVVFSNVSGFPFAELKRLPFNSSTIYEAFANVQTILKATINLENEVIIDGCSIINVDTGATTVTVSAGLVMYSGEMVITSQYSGIYPCYLKGDGSWVTVQPMTGAYIKFDPYTSQRYKDVLKRFNYQTGHIIMSKVLSDRFDVGTGLGKWEWQGWKICDEMGGRSPLGYDRRTDGSHEDGIPANEKVWDIANNTIWNTGGEKAHQLSRSELPHEQINNGLNQGGAGYLDQTPFDNIGTGSGTPLKTDFLGDGVPHNNLPPFRVVAFLERI